MKKVILLVIPAVIMLGCNNESTTTRADSDTSNTITGNNTSNNNSDTGLTNGLMGSMHAMMSKMNGMKMTGDFDIDFASMMIEHHQGAIDMSQLELNGGSDEKIKGIAQNISVNQKKEIEELRSFISGYKPSGMKHGEGELQKSMTAMDAKINAMQMSGNMDRDYANMMISHHEAAIEMSKKQLEHGMSEDLKKMAQKMIMDQTAEIKRFKEWLNKNS